MKIFLACLAIAASASTLSALPHQAPAPPPAPAQTASPTPAAPATPPASRDQRINGRWHFVFDTQGGDRPFEAEFAVDPDGKVTGTWNGKPASGTYHDGQLHLDFEFFSEDANETAQLKLDGKLDDSGAITGNWIFSSYDGTFKATHP
jgi:hypothetical protein